MDKKYFENTTSVAMFVGGKLLQPGEGREFNADDLPPEHQEAEPVAELVAPTLNDQSLEILTGNVASVIARLPALPEEALDMLAALEGGAAKPRTSLLAAIADEKIARADAALKSDEL